MPNYFKGTDFILSIHDGVSFVEIACMRSTTSSISNETIDVTSKCNMPFRHSINGGLRAMSFSGSGVMNDGADMAPLLIAANLNLITRFRLNSGRGDFYDGDFSITSLERTGEHADAEMFDLTLESAGFTYYIAAVSQLIQPEEIDAQAGEGVGRQVSISGDGSIITGSSEAWDDGATINVGRFFVWSNNPITLEIELIATIEPPIAWNRFDELRFSRFTEVNYAGDMIFVTGRGSPGIAIYTISSGVVDYWKTIEFPEYTALDIGARGNEGRISKDNRTLIITCSNGGNTPTAADTYAIILRSEDDWDTFSVLHTIPQPGGTGKEPMGTMDVSTDFDFLTCANWRENKVYGFRTSDDWASFSTYTLPNPVDIPFGAAGTYGISLAVADSDLVYIGSPYTENQVDVVEYNSTLDQYDYKKRITNGSGSFGEISINADGNLIYVAAPTASLSQNIYNVADDTLIQNPILDSMEAVGSSRFAVDDNGLVLGIQDQDNGAKADAGAVRYMRL